MKQILARSAVLGLILGVVCMGLATLGLAISIFEILKPVLAPGVYLVQFMGVNTDTTILLLLALCLNVLVYSLIVLGVFLTHERFSKPK